jgi:spermidine synthase
MAVEMVAGRMLSRYVGASIYTWTSVIGIVLAGMTLGNYLGGRIADRFPSQRTLSVIFILAGMSCVSIPSVNHVVAVWSDWDVVSNTYWPLRVATHVAGVFFIPSICMGLVGPVVAKRALDVGLQAGRTVGNVYAFGALGSIVGTFVSGFYFIAAGGTAGVVFTAGAFLISVGILLAPRASRSVLVVAWPILLACVAGYLLASATKTSSRGWYRGKRPQTSVLEMESLYSDDTQYSYIKVVENRWDRTLSLFLDNLVHALYRPGDVTSLEYDYEKLYASLSERFGKGLEGPNILCLGGGGYIYPRYLQIHWPKCKIQVAEIDPGVTEACFAAFDLKREQVLVMDGKSPEERKRALGARQTPDGLNRIEIYHLDARQHVEDLLKRKERGEPVEPFDFVYGDAFSDYSVPCHLVTKEFTAKVKSLMRPDTGLYMINIIEIFSSGQFLGAVYNTVSEIFPKIYLFCTTPNGPNYSPTGRDTFIVVGAFRDLDLKDLGNRPGEIPFEGTLIGEEHLAGLKERSRGVVLTDDYSPVEILLEPVVSRRAQH